MNTAASFLLAFAISLVSTRILVALGRRRAAFARAPTGDRWHRAPTPSFGGVAIFAGFLCASLAFGRFLPYLAPLLAVASLIFLAGLADDVRPFPAYAKLAVQIALGAAFVFLNLRSAQSGNPFLFVGVTAFWIVFMANAFNLIDNMDGLSSGIALIAIFFMIAIDRVSAGTLPLPLVAALGGAILGFFVFNFPPAKIFMGDCGSQFIGFTLACFAVLDSWQNTTNIFFMLLAPVLIFAVPIFDTTLVTVLRKYHGRPISQGGRDHTSHRLVGLGLSERGTVAVLWTIAAVFGTVAVLTQILEAGTWGIIIAGLLATSLVFGILLAQERRAAPVREAPRGFFPINIFFQRRLVEVLIDAILIAMSYGGAYLLRYDWDLDPYYSHQLARTLPLVLGIKMPLMLVLGLYRGFWVYIDFETVVRDVKILFLTSAFTVAVFSFFFRFEGFSRTLFAIDFVLLVLSVLGSRALLRWAREMFFAYPIAGVPVVIVGAHPRYKPLLLDIRRNRQWNLRPVAIVDPEAVSAGGREADVELRAGIAALEKLLEARAARHVAVLEEDLVPATLDRVREACARAGAACIVLQSIEKTLVARVRGGEPEVPGAAG